MKAILVIDIGNKKIDDYYAEVTIMRKDNHTTTLRKPHIDLKEMPGKKVPVFDPNHCDMEEEIRIINEIAGWNACIEEILGENE